MSEEDEINDFIEVDVLDDEPPCDDEDDDNSTTWGTEIEDNISLANENEEVIDMSISSFKAHRDSVYCAAIHPKNPLLIVTGGGDDNGFLWSYYMNETDENNSNLGSKIQKCNILTGHKDSVISVGFNFDGSLIFTASLDGTIIIWKVDTIEQVGILEGPEDIEWAEWHPKGNALIAGSSDGTIWMWLAGTGQCLQVFAGHDGKVSCGLFTRDGKLIVSGGDDGTVRVWNPKTGVCKHTYEGHFAHEGTVTCIASSLDGDLIVTGRIIF
jgi:ribosome assembly protein SQT1